MEVGERQPAKAWVATVASVLMIASLGAAGWGYIRGQSGEERDQPRPDLEKIPTQIGKWKAKERSEQERKEDTALFAGLMCDTGVHREYQSTNQFPRANEFHSDVHLYVMFYHAKNARYNIHHPDVCWPNRGWKPLVANDASTQLTLKNGIKFTVRMRRYEQEGRRHLILFWMQDGPNVWTYADEQALNAHASNFAWVRYWLENGVKPRLPFLSGLAVAEEGTADSDEARRKMEELLAVVVDTLQEECPWSIPTQP